MKAQTYRLSFLTNLKRRKMEGLTQKNMKENILIINKQHPEWGAWGVLRKYDTGIWEIRGNSGDRVLFESEFRFWVVANLDNICDKKLT